MYAHGSYGAGARVGAGAGTGAGAGPEVGAGAGAGAGGGYLYYVASCYTWFALCMVLLCCTLLLQKWYLFTGGVLRTESWYEWWVGMSLQ